MYYIDLSWFKDDSTEILAEKLVNETVSKIVINNKK